jgi:hypothetical protein
VFSGRNRALRLRAEIVRRRAERDVIDRRRIRRRATRHRRLGERIVNLEIQGLVGNRRIRIDTHIENRGTLGDGAGRNRGEAEHYVLREDKS